MSAHRFQQSVSYISRPPGTSFDTWDLFCAAAEGHLPVMRELIEKEPELIHYPIWYEFPIHFAVRGGHIEAVQLLLDFGTNPAWSNFRYSSWQKLLPMAASRDTEVYDLLVAEMQRRFHYDPNYKLLFAAIGLANTEEVSQIINEQPDLIHVGDGHGNRALHWAVLSRRLPVIEKLLDAGADIHARRADLQTPLHLSALGNDYWFGKSDCRDPTVSREAVTDLLLERGADYEFSAAVVRGDRQRVDQVLSEDPGAATRLNESRRSPLGLAAKNGHFEIVRSLLDCGANPNLAEECCSRGAGLFEACARNDVAMVKLFLEHGADPNAEADSSGNCLSIAEHCKRENTPEVIRLLHEAGAELALWQLDTAEQIHERLRADDTLSPDDTLWGGILTKILQLADRELLQTFVNRYGDEPIRNLDPANGWNSVSSPEFLDLLVGHGMDTNRPDWLGQTYLHCFVKTENTERAGLYIDKGIDINAVDFANGLTALGVAEMNDNEIMVEFLLERGADR